MDMKGKVAIVTGGAQGIGKAYCTLFLKKGMKVCICDIQENPGESIADLLNEGKENVLYQKCDVTSLEDFTAAFEKTKQKFGRIDVVVNNAGMMSEQKNWRRCIDVNLTGTVIGVKLGFEFMSRDKGGSGGWIINTSSVATFETQAITPVYSATKHGVNGLTRCYGTDYHFEKTGVKVAAVSPGSIDTPLFHVFTELTLDPPVARGWLSDITTKLIKPEEVAKGVLKIMEDGKNGSIMRVDEKGMYYA